MHVHVYPPAVLVHIDVPTAQLFVPMHSLMSVQTVAPAADPYPLAQARQVEAVLAPTVVEYVFAAQSVQLAASVVVE